MFGSGIRADSLSESRRGHTAIIRPSSGTRVQFGCLRAGDFFSYSGKLYLKINLVDAVEIPSGSDPIVGTSQFSASCEIHVERVEISIR